MPTLLRKPEDLAWLQQVHNIPAVCAVLHGTEDAPDKVEVFIKDGLPPLVYVPDGKMNLCLVTGLQTAPQNKIYWASRAALAELLRLEVDGELDTDGRRAVVDLYEALRDAGYDVTDYQPDVDEIKTTLDQIASDAELPISDTTRDGIRTVTWNVAVPGDAAEGITELGHLAIHEAQQNSYDYCMPAEWRAERVKGELGAGEVVFCVTRRSRS